MAAGKKPVLIIGAGVVGLTLAHGLKKEGIPFRIFERDESVFARGQGWAITIHWALPYLRRLLNPETLAAIEQCQVDPAVGRNDNGAFLFLNLATCETKFRIPPNERRRVNREKLRRALLNGVEDYVCWSKRLIDINTSSDTAETTVTFDDGSSFTGSIVVGADGTNSAVRKHLCPETYRNRQLPIRFVGAAIDMTKTEVTPLRKLDPLLFQGCHPTTSTFMWVSMLEVPESNGSFGTSDEKYRVQINLSWPVSSAEDEVKTTDRERLLDMQRRVEPFAPVLRNLVKSIPKDTSVLEIKLADWPCLEWANREGKVTLCGDAAHAMTMYRGEAANHGMLDAHNLCQALKLLYAGTKSQRDVVAAFEAEMRQRTSHAVSMSRQACFDAHDWARLDENSAVLSKRAIVVK